MSSPARRRGRRSFGWASPASPATLPARAAVLAAAAAAVLDVPARSFRRVAVDGVDGAGKTVFADELSEALRGAGAAVVRASVDGFHNPPALRHRRGRSSPEGFFHDSYDYDRFVRLLLDPFAPDGSGRHVRRVYDVAAETPVPELVEQAPPGAVLVVDGIFLHRDELADRWDYSIWLEVPFAISVPRGAQRGSGDPDPSAPSNRRYVEGQRLYLSECAPQRRADLVVDNADLARPLVVPTGQWSSPSSDA